jgi:thiol-disulfide isomerase/thioredoxin
VISKEQTLAEQTLKKPAEASSTANRGTCWAALCLVVVAAAGCGGSDPQENAPTPPPAQTSTAPAEQTGAVDAGQMRTVTAEQIRTLVNDRKGKVVVVNFWASWCPPCVREFPAIIKVYEQYRGRGLDMIGVSMNSPEEMADIEEFLQTYKPPFPIFLGDTQNETFSEGVLEEWYGEMPLTLVFNTAGERVLAHKKELTYEDLASKVEPLLPPQ